LRPWACGLPCSISPDPWPFFAFQFTTQPTLTDQMVIVPAHLQA
jgi:hypothetical protein